MARTDAGDACMGVLTSAEGATPAPDLVAPDLAALVVSERAPGQ